MSESTSGRVRVVDTRKQAEGIFKTFHARNPARDVPVHWTWPDSMIEAGIGQSEMYESNKWKSSLSEYDQYKHVAEGPRLTYISRGWLREWANPNKPIPVVGDVVSFEGPMPKHFAILGKLLGVQIRLFVKNKSGEIALPAGDDGLYEIRVRQGMLGGAIHPGTRQPFVFVYTKAGGVHMMMTGDELDIGKDGIEG
jgi:hypothetical protein